MNDTFIQVLYDRHQDCDACPPRQKVLDFFNDLIGLLFPDLSKQKYSSTLEFNSSLLKTQSLLEEILRLDSKIPKALREGGTKAFFDVVPTIYESLMEDANAMYEGDPASISLQEVIRSYPGFKAIAAYRVAHVLLNMGVRLMPRMITESMHSLTGIDIHPGATIGRSFCIDHGTGVVIGETCLIGDHVKIYQGVTLGALSVRKEDAQIKRHPTIEDNVTIYANATILGGKTIIGHDSIIGGNTWTTRSVEPNSKIYYKEQS